MTRVYLEVPYEEKEFAKSKWCKNGMRKKEMVGTRNETGS